MSWLLLRLMADIGFMFGVAAFHKVKAWGLAAIAFGSEAVCSGVFAQLFFLFPMGKSRGHGKKARRPSSWPSGFGGPQPPWMSWGPGAWGNQQQHQQQDSSSDYSSGSGSAGDEGESAASTSNKRNLVLSWLLGCSVLGFMA